jgi:hypothetical protein
MGQLEDAAQCATRPKLHGACSMLDLGDRPQKLLADIQTGATSNAAQAAAGAPAPATKPSSAVPQAVGPKPTQSRPPKPPTRRSPRRRRAVHPCRPAGGGAGDPTKQRAVMMLAERASSRARDS